MSLDEYTYPGEKSQTESKKQHGFAVMRLKQEIHTSGGDIIDCNNGEVIGMMPVFRTKAAARKVYGHDVELIEIMYNKPK